MSDVREYSVRAQTTTEFGRVLCSARTHHFIIDGPAANGCPGEALTPPEAFLSGVAACGVELLQVLAKDLGKELRNVHLQMIAQIDRANPVRTDLTVFNSVRLKFALAGVSSAEAHDLVDRFRRR